MTRFGKVLIGLCALAAATMSLTVSSFAQELTGTARQPLVNGSVTGRAAQEQSGLLSYTDNGST